MATQPNQWSAPQQHWGLSVSRADATPEREAAFFYGLFLRGHAVDDLRRDISVPREVRARWEKDRRQDPFARLRYDEILVYRRQVLAIFDSLVCDEKKVSHLRQ